MNYVERHRRRKWRRKPMREKKRRRLLMIAECQDHHCVLCGQELIFVDPLTNQTYVPRHPRRVTFEHVEPKSRAKHQRFNLLASHKVCNELKADSPPTGCELIWLQVVKARMPGKILLAQQEQLSYSDSQRQRIEKETDPCLISKQPNAKNETAAAA